MTPADLRAWREVRSLSRAEASQVLGVNSRTLEDLESGRRSGSVLMPVLERLTMALERLGL